MSLAIDVAAWSTPWRLRNTGEKALLCLGLTGCALILPVLPAAPIVLVCAVGLALGPARVPWRVFLSVVRTPAVFIVLAALPVAVSVSTGPLLLEVTAASAAKAGELALHGLAGSAAVLLLAVTTPMSDLLAGLRRIGVPEAVVDVAQVTYRMVFALLDSVAAIRAAQTGRLGYANRAAALRSAAGLTASVLTRAFSQARRLEEGLTSRGMVGSMTVLREPRAISYRFVAGSTVGLGLLVVGSLLARAAGLA